MLAIRVFIHTLLPEPVAPAIKTCGIFAISVTIASPETSFPSANASFDLCSLNSSVCKISLMCTTSLSSFGTSIPTACFPGIGASILIDLAAKFKAISSARFAILLTRTPSAGFNSYLVIAGPTVTFSTFAWTPKLYNVFWSLVATSVKAFAPPFIAFLVPLLNNSTGGYS